MCGETGKEHIGPIERAGPVNKSGTLSVPVIFVQMSDKLGNLPVSSGVDWPVEFPLAFLQHLNRSLRCGDIIALGRRPESSHATNTIDRTYWDNMTLRPEYVWNLSGWPATMWAGPQMRIPAQPDVLEEVKLRGEDALFLELSIRSEYAEQKFGDSKTEKRLRKAHEMWLALPEGQRGRGATDAIAQTISEQEKVSALTILRILNDKKNKRRWAPSSQ